MVEATGGDLQAALKHVFKDYCAGQATMDGKSWAKLCKDTKLIDKKLTATDVDLIFAKSKAKTDRRITYDQWLTALGHAADKKGCGADAVHATVAASKGPILAGTKAEATRFHDDKSAYTGVHAHGGPSTVDTDKIADISQTLDRSAADVRGNKIQSDVAHVTHKVAGVVLEEEKKAAPKGTGKKASATPQEAAKSAPAASLQAVFMEFSAGAKEIDGKTWAKLAVDTKIVNKQCTKTDIDLIFAKVKDKTARKITYAQFAQAIEQCAAKRGESQADLEATILASGGKTLTGTQAQATRFHDDKDAYTGVYAHGGPSSASGKVDDISQLLDRGAADVRGVAKK